MSGSSEHEDSIHSSSCSDDEEMLYASNFMKKIDDSKNVEKIAKRAIKEYQRCVEERREFLSNQGWRSKRTFKNISATEIDMTDFFNETLDISWEIFDQIEGELCKILGKYEYTISKLIDEGYHSDRYFMDMSNYVK